MKKASLTLFVFQLVLAELALLNAFSMLITGAGFRELNDLWTRIFNQPLDYVSFFAFYIGYSIVTLLFTFIIFVISFVTYRKDDPKLVLGILQIALIGGLCIPGGIFYIIWSTQKKDHEQILEDNN